MTRARTTPRTPFNPFVVLSDVTIATLVILSCLLVIVTTVSEAERNQHDRLIREFERREQRFKTELAHHSARWNSKIAVSYASGPQAFLVRLAGAALFDAQQPERLSGVGSRAVSDFAVSMDDSLSVLTRPGITGDLIEVQVRGNCRRHPEADGKKLDPMEVSLARARKAAEILRGHRRFPWYLVTILGASWNRPAYLSTDDALRRAREDGLAQTVGRRRSEQIQDELRGLSDQSAIHLLDLQGVRKPALKDRLDILFVYSGEKGDDDYVQVHSRDGRVVGPPNDTSGSRFAPESSSEPPPGGSG